MIESIVAHLEPWRVWLWTTLAVLAGIVAGLVARRILFSIVSRLTGRTRKQTDDVLVAALRGPAALILPAFGVQLALMAVPYDGAMEDFLRHALALVLIAGVGWLVVSLLGAGGRLLIRRYGRGDHSLFAERSLETRIHLLTRVATTLVVVIVGAVMLMTIPAVRQLGTSILASAGIAGIVAGLAAQSILANLLAGVQLAVTEPVRLGDAVVIEGEFGTIEEIGSTFVVVRLWDLRRLIVPVNYFLGNRFENWTLNSTDLLGTAVLYVDYSAPVDELRNELQRIVERSADWDHKTAVLQVTDASDRSVKIRALVSADDPAKLWNLRCEVREQLLLFLQKNCPNGLPRIRAEFAPAAGVAWPFQRDGGGAPEGDHSSPMKRRIEPASARP